MRILNLIGAATLAGLMMSAAPASAQMSNDGPMPGRHMMHKRMMMHDRMMRHHESRMMHHRMMRHRMMRHRMNNM